ncbi:MAG: SPFH domain-containing protein [Sandaracinaceae bacterium]|jgi:membrane protease subunit (stomatin/prohibitin family)|nr:SPFH domain-containing protein [Sandaracinaceae bacterium]
MGIVDFIRRGVGEMIIARPPDKKDLLVFKHPDPTIPMYAQLTVDSDEAAVFFRDGAVAGTLRTAGINQRHTLDSQNIPFLSNFVDSFTGGNIFKTDLFFVTTRPIYDVKFGDELGSIADPQLGEMVTPRMFGSFAFEVFDPALFILKYTGLRTGGDDLKWIKGLFMNSVRTVVGEVLVTEQKSMLQLLPMQQMLADRFLQRAPDLNMIGVRITQMGDFRINLTDEDTALLQKAQSEIGAAQRKAKIASIAIAEAEAIAKQKQFELDQQFQNQSRYVNNLAGGNYQNYASAQAMIGAGQGMAKGGGEGGGAMMTGAGLGVGMGMAQAFQQQQYQQQQNNQQQQHGGGGGAAPAAPAGALVACPACNAQVPPGKFCQECGGGLSPKPKLCASCGTQGVPTARFCAGCGTAYPQ